MKEKYLARWLAVLEILKVSMNGGGDIKLVLGLLSRNVDIASVSLKLCKQSFMKKISLQERKKHTKDTAMKLRMHPTTWLKMTSVLVMALTTGALFVIYINLITISPFEWSFPFAKWLSDIRQCTGMGQTQLSGYETYNITHVLEQIVRGYLCGSTSQKWSEHVFSYNKIANYPNIKTFFYRFEFQERGTVHLHMLVWLEDIRRTQHQFLRAEIPRSHPDLAFLVHQLQPSDKKSH